MLDFLRRLQAPLAFEFRLRIGLVFHPRLLLLLHLLVGKLVVAVRHAIQLLLRQASRVQFRRERLEHVRIGVLGRHVLVRRVGAP